MKLEDFFTLTDMSNGFTSPVRVQELVFILQKEKDCIVKNAGENARHWAAVACTIIATENKECLELFVRLDGLCFIESWLRAALRFRRVTRDYFLKESTNHLIAYLLRAVERLHVDIKDSVSSGIWVTVKSLIGHKSSKVQERAKALFHSWDQGEDETMVSVGIEKVQASTDDRTREAVNVFGEKGWSEPSSGDGGSREEKERVGNNSQSDDIHQSRVGETRPSDQNLGHARMKDVFPSSSLANPFTEGQKAENPTYHVEGNTSAMDQLQKQTDVYSEDTCRRKSSCHDASVAVPMRTTLVDDSRPANHARRIIVLEAKQDMKYKTDMLQDSDEHNLGHPVDFVIGQANKHTSDKSEDDLENRTGLEEAAGGGKDSSVLGKKSDIELDYGKLDPLGVARRVAIEVEREVEQSCSSSEKIKESKVLEPDSPDSMTAKQSHKVESSIKEVSREMACFTDASIASSEAGPINGTEKVESSQVVGATSDFENVDKGLCNFDLNLEACTDGIVITGNPISTSISVVTASRAAAAPGVPVTPLQFEGPLGWKGSSATSAFRPASPRQIPETEKAGSSRGTDSSSKHLPGCHDIDLNASEVGDGRVANLFPVKQVSVSSALPLVKSYPEASPKHLEKLELDLNCASEEGEAPSDWRIEGRHFSLRNGHQSQSPSSSSSKQPPLMGFDLNDQPSSLNDFSDLNNFKKNSQNINASAGVKLGDSVMSIIGMNRKDFAAESFPILNNWVAENVVDYDIARDGGVLGMGSTFPYAYPPPGFHYNGNTVVPPRAFSSWIYRHRDPIPYMVDSKGAAILPLCSAPVPNEVGPSQSGLDLNAGSILDGGNRDHGGGLRQLLDQEQARSMDEHFRTNSQSSTSLSIAGKRKEPDGNWEPYPVKHHPPRK